MGELMDRFELEDSMFLRFTLTSNTFITNQISAAAFDTLDER